ncbi:hypothetical protein [uncultured Algimonas sp.]|uniref:hypothetical protein n=1 Tax=uncultured Algimonas sp. TaxID=1547920 RepID=UPI00263277BC|nr:hypothetical protein [uncultured Algimonas sp.]
MRSVINMLAAISALVAAALSVNLVVGFATGAYDGRVGLSTADMQLIALIAAVLAVALGFVGRIQDRRRMRPTSRLSNFSIAAGLLFGLLVLALPFVFG